MLEPKITMAVKRIVYTIFILLLGCSSIAQKRAVIESLLTHLKIVESDTAKADIYNDLCWNYRVDSPKLGYECGLKALAIYTQQKNILKQCNVLNKLGINKRNTGEYSAALDNFYKILDIAERPSCNLEIAYAYNNIADIYTRLEKFDKAIEFINKALPIFKLEGNNIGIAYNLNLNGTIYQNKKDWAEALKYLKLGLNIRLKMNDVAGAASSFVNIGNCCLELNIPDTALVYFRKGIEYYDKAGFTNYGQSYISLGRYYSAKKDYPKAIYYLKEAIFKARETKSPINVQSAHEALHRVYYCTKDYKKAYEVQSLARNEDDTLRKSDYIKKITTLELNYSFEQQVRQKEIDDIKKNTLYESSIYKQKLFTYGLVLLLIGICIVTFFVFKNYRFVEKTNHLLKKYNDEISSQKISIQSQNELLQELVATKDKFFNIIAHDLKNPFYGILGMSEEIVTSGQVYSHEETIQMVKMIRDSSQNAFNLLENLLEWSKAQTGRIDFNPENFMLDRLIVDVVRLLENYSIQKNITITYSISKDFIIFADQNMVHTILRNLITNAIKFTEEYGKIFIVAQRLPGEIRITVSDTGIGITENIKNKLFLISEKITSLGTKNEKGTGLGLLLCKEFVEKHGGRIWVESEPGKGSHFNFTIPVLPGSKY
jgi:signal transduction histidine kinase